MASRAITSGTKADSLVSRLDSWRLMLDDMFVADWGNLAITAVEPNAFAESWFLGPALAQFDSEGRVQLFALWEGNRLVGLMPVAPQAQYGRWPVPHVQNWLHHNAFLGTPLVRVGFEEAFWSALLSLLDQQPGQALFAHFNCLTTNGPLVAALEQVCLTERRRCALVHSEERALLEGNLSPNAYFETAVRG